MNGSEEPVEIEVEPEIQNILPFEDFYIDQFVDYLENDINGNGHDTSSQIENHQKHQSNSNNNNSHHHKPCNYQCTVCRETLGSGSELLKHVRTHTRMFGSYNQRNLKKHKNCCICMRSFDHPSKLKIHEETQHLPPFRCRFCNSYHTALKYYKMHLKLHLQQQKRYLSSSSHVPEQLSMSSIHHRNNNHHKQSKKSGFKHFYTPQKLTTANIGNLASLAVQTNHHGLPSSSLSPLRCKYCGKLFAKFTTLRKHEMIHRLNGNHQQQPQQSSNDSIRINPEVDVGDVNNSASAAESLHKSTALTLTPSLLSNLNKLANLKSSEYNDGKKPAILININTNDTPQVETAKIKSQEMPLNSSSGLMISSVSSVDKNYFEAVEKQKDSSAATVFIQNGKKAVSLADLQCPICKKIVSQPFSLKVHLRTHTLEKPYSCPVCNKSFSQSCNLKTHMNIHNKHQYNQQPPPQQSNNNENPFMCNICNKTFLKASSLNTHMITHTAKLYCYACNINFKDDALTYSQHMQVTHNVVMTKDLMSSAKANLQRSESINQQQSNESGEEKINSDEQPRLKEVFQVESSSVQNGQIPKLKITIKKEPMIKQEPVDGNESDSSTSSSSSSNSSSSSSSSSGSSSSSTSNNNNSNDEKNDNNNC